MPPPESTDKDQQPVERHWHKIKRKANLSKNGK